MSTLARYFHVLGKDVGGYDKTPSDLIVSLIDIGIEVNYQDTLDSIPNRFYDVLNKDEILIIYTPAVPADSIQLNFFIHNKFLVFKRSQILGEISKEYRTLAVAGSHGKTTISAMVAEVLRSSESGGSAFLGGISKNIDSNLQYQPNSEIAVMEADEFDKSFHSLYPSLVLVSSMDPDHLDIYGDTDQLRASFSTFMSLLPEGGIAVIKNGLDSIVPSGKEIVLKYYGLEAGGDYYAANIKSEGLVYQFDLATPRGIIHGLKTAVPGLINIENAVGASALCLEAGLSENDVRQGISSFKGIKRRFDVRINTAKLVYIDDYAHHPKEIKAFLESVNRLFPEKKITGVFQPHLFSRTRDFAKEFGKELSLLDELILLEIYPAREKPIEGVTSGLIMEYLTIENKELVNKDELLNTIKGKRIEVLLTMGAGDIDRIVEPIENFLQEYAS